MYTEERSVSDESLNKASGGVVGDPGFMKRYKVYDNKTGKHVASFWRKSNALDFDSEYNGGSGEVIDEDSARFARYKSDWEDYNNTQKFRIINDNK